MLEEDEWRCTPAFGILDLFLLLALACCVKNSFSFNFFCTFCPSREMRPNTLSGTFSCSFVLEADYWNSSSTKMEKLSVVDGLTFVFWGSCGLRGLR
jgi:hypothetical protein